MKIVKLLVAKDNLNRKAIEIKLPNFKKFLTERGAEVLVTTNEWEVIRFVTDKGTGIIYSNKRGDITFYGVALVAWDAFVNAKSWRAFPAIKRSGSNIINTIRARDGDKCFYCLQDVRIQDESEEHLLSLTHGGPNNLHNKVLAHRQCNNDAGSLPLSVKIKLHIAAQLRKK